MEGSHYGLVKYSFYTKSPNKLFEYKRVVLELPN